MMNPRRVHELMTANFPSVEMVTLDWVNVLEADGTIRSEVLDALILEFIPGDDILVEVSRKLGDLKTKKQVIPYVQEHVGKGQIRLADRDFQGYVLIGMNGVAAGWSST
jgi:L-fucose mutarotase/ribose pyranase (RbsD/FucU family)